MNFHSSPLVKNTIGFLCVFAYNISSKIGKGERCMRETRTTEFKEKITNTFLKTVSAFSNYDGGEIFLVWMTMAISKDCQM